MKIHHQNVFEPWTLQDKSVQAIITSPPYFGLRKYDIPDIIIGGISDCKHEWNVESHIDKRGKEGTTLDGRDPNKDESRLNYIEGTCIFCGAWKGQYGLEPSMKLFIEHTLLWCEEAWRVLRDDGIFFLNLGDSYGGSWGNFGTRKGHQRQRTTEHFKRMGATPEDLKPPTVGAASKCKLLIPHRIAIALCDSGWILRNDIIWQKPNCMPESCQDRFSKKFEYIFMFSKQKKYYFDLDATREPHEQISLDRIKSPFNPTKVEGRAVNNKGDMSRFCHPKGKNPGDIWKIATQPSTHSHYAMWPEKLVERMIKCSTQPGDAVLDPFCGSGTTLMVAEQLNREGIGIDLGYKDIQDDRLAAVQKSLLEII